MSLIRISFSFVFKSILNFRFITSSSHTAVAIFTEQISLVYGKF